MKNGVSPREVGFMGLYEMFSTFSKMTKSEDKPMTQARMDELKSSWRSLGLPDVSV